MRRFIVLLLITKTVWAQTGLDKLVLEDGTEFFQELIQLLEIRVLLWDNGLSFQCVDL